MLQNAVKGNKGAMRAYLAFMGPHLAEMHRLRKDTGRIYLHCDPTASHYFKGIMDAIFDERNLKDNEFFRNEIIWSYRTGGASKKEFAKKHDIIEFYQDLRSPLCKRGFKPRLQGVIRSYHRKVRKFCS